MVDEQDGQTPSDVNMDETQSPVETQAPIILPSGEPQVPPPPGEGEVASRNAVQLARAAAVRQVGKTIARIITWLVVLALAVLLAIGVVTYWPQVFDLVVSPIETNTASIDDLEDDVARLNRRLDDLDTGTDTGALFDRIATLEAAQTQIDQRSFLLEQREEELVAALARQEAVALNLGEAIDAFQLELNALEIELATLEESLADDAIFVEYNRQLLLIRAGQELLIARIRLSESNVGLAAEHITLARTALQSAYELSGTDDRLALDPVFERLDLVDANLEENPFVAFTDLDTAWTQLSTLLRPVDLDADNGDTEPKTDETPTEEPAATATPEATPTPS